MDTKNQLLYFLLSLCIGFLGGIIYNFFAFLRFSLGCNHEKRRGLGITLDVVFCLLFAIYCIFIGFFLQFPDFRGYMGVGFWLGLIISIKILQITLAFFKKVCYNRVTNMGKKAKKREKLFKKGD